MIDVVAKTNDTYPRYSTSALEEQSADGEIVHRPERHGRVVPPRWHRAASPCGWTAGEWNDSF
jgi:hypothetical protein